MLTEFTAQVAATVLTTVGHFLPSAIAFAALFTVLSLFTSQACNPGRTWWRSPSLFTDLCYMVIIPFIAPYMRMALMIWGAALISGVVTTDQIVDYFQNGRGLVGGLPFWAQVIVYVVVSDVLLYWNHRIFHGAAMWRFHAIHHSAEDVDWTTSYRFHPVNLWAGSFLIAAVMLFAGIPPAVLLFLVPLDTTTASFVHANLNWTLGPLKYVLSTPVFHRWHHTPLDQGGNSNFGSLFSVWDVLFGTFYMPQGVLPTVYGIDDADFPRDFIGQIVQPFRTLIPNRPAPPAATSQPPTP